ncbi:N-acetyltransferase family protein [Serratia fonticola]|uniref:GNAT family N-acetyltransferase n=1 Tax=Serratia fonticola TaxID=47917 RepID=UPI0015768151|nr:GNAT family N-acetyltransferase [Serratia fonticola]NTY86326.1 N-acetyltransferase family protein [Serratia fonticola]NTZ11982.1 N-acetyltransferase family protein [Serratia fonticola]
MSLATPPLATLSVSDASTEDMAAIQQIYAHHVLYGPASFEETPPTLEEMQQRRHSVLAAGLPWLVAKMQDRVVGYCYATPYRPRPAYRYTIENSVYVAEGLQGHGIGKTLLSSLIARCEHGPWRQMLATIGDAAGNAGSLALHRKLGFTSIGTLSGVGFKFGGWLDTHIMQRPLNGGSHTLP